MAKVRIEQLRLGMMLVLLSASAWLVFGGITQSLSPVLQYAPGIDLVYLPAGVRLGIILLFGGWGAIGIATASPLLFQGEFGDRSHFEVAVNSLICGLAPLLTVKAAMHMLGVGRNLEHLRAMHLTLLALAVSVVTPLAFNISFMAFDYKPAEDFGANLTAMMLGDFVGCLVVLIAIRGAIFFYRKVSPGRA